MEPKFSLTLSNDFVAYCKLNNKEPEAYAAEVFEQWFNLIKYGSAPPIKGVQSKYMTVEISPPLSDFDHTKTVEMLSNQDAQENEGLKQILTDEAEDIENFHKTAQRMQEESQRRKTDGVVMPDKITEVTKKDLYGE